MADIVTNTLQIGSNNLVLRDADAQAKIATNTQDISGLKEDLNTIIPVTGTEDTLEWITGGGQTTRIYLEANKSYIIKNVTPEVATMATGGLFIVGYDEEYAVEYPSIRDQTVVFTPLHSGYLRMYSAGDGPKSASLRICGIVDNINAELKILAKRQSDQNVRPASYLANTGFDDNGNTIYSGSSCVTDYIPVLPGILVSVFEPKFNGHVNGCTFYGKNKNVIKFISFAPRFYGSYVPDGAYFMRISIIMQYYDDVIIRVNPVSLACQTASELRMILDRATYADKRYTVLLRNGVYDIGSTFTAEEINNAEYTVNGWCGLTVGDNMHLVGESRDGVVLTCNLPSSYAASNRNAISTLNVRGNNCVLEDMTVTSQNIRYPIHDDFPESANGIHKFINCNFIAGLNGTGEKTNGYGMGSRSGETIILENCYIDPYMVYHNNTGFTKPSNVIMNNCEVTERLALWDFACEVNCYLHLNNVKGNCLHHSFNGTHEQTIQIDGTGQNPDMIVCNANVKYNLGNCIKKYIHYGANAGEAMADYYADGDQKWCTAKHDNVMFMGIMLDDTSPDAVGIIQTSGYICGHKLGATNMDAWQRGTYLKVNSETCLLEPTSDKTAAVAYVAVIINGLPIIKLIA